MLMKLLIRFTLFVGLYAFALIKLYANVSSTRELFMAVFAALVLGFIMTIIYIILFPSRKKRVVKNSHEIPNLSNEESRRIRRRSMASNNVESKRRRRTREHSVVSNNEVRRSERVERPERVDRESRKFQDTDKLEIPKNY